MSYIAKNGRLYTSGASEALTLLDDKFSVNKSYSKGDSCIYNDYLWKFTSDKPAGEWDSSVVEQCRVMDFVDDANGRLTQVQSQIVPTASIEIGETASKAYNVDDFLVKDGALYKVTKAIAQGDALTVGTNIVITTVGGELSGKSNSTDNYKLIWTNPNDDSGFDAQTITLDETGTVFLLDITIDNAITYIYRSHLIAPVMSTGTTICLFGARTEDNNTGKRNVKITSTQTQTIFEFGAGYPANNWMRPHAIYKVK